MENTLPTPTNDSRMTPQNNTEDEADSAPDSHKEPVQKTVNTENTDEFVTVKNNIGKGIHCAQQINS